MSLQAAVNEITIKVIGIIDESMIKPISQPDLTPAVESNLYDDLGLDSMDHIDIICDLETEFEISIELNEFVKVQTVQDVIDFIVKIIMKDMKVK